MLRSCLWLLLVPVTVSAGDPPKPVAMDGKIVPMVDALKALGIKADADTDGMALVAVDGKLFTVVKDDVSRKLFLDPELHDRPVRLTAVVLAGTQCLQVRTVQLVKDGRVFDVDYWCDQCQLAASQPGKCLCCGSDVVRREYPALPDPKAKK